MHAERFTHHAQSRMQQRAIPSVVVEYLEDFGTVVRCNGADRVIFDKAAQKRLRHHLGGRRSLAQFDHWFDVYAVYSDRGEILTVARQTKRHLRN